MKNKRFGLGNRDFLHEIFGNIPRIYDKIGIDVKDEKVTIQMYVITSRLEAFRLKRFDRNLL
jgi:hypothetical protein